MNSTSKLTPQCTNAEAYFRSGAWLRAYYTCIHHASPAVGICLYILQYRRHMVNGITEAGKRERSTHKSHLGMRDTAAIRRVAMHGAPHTCAPPALAGTVLRHCGARRRWRPLHFCSCVATTHLATRKPLDAGSSGLRMKGASAITG